MREEEREREIYIEKKGEIEGKISIRNFDLKQFLSDLFFPREILK